MTGASLLALSRQERGGRESTRGSKLREALLQFGVLSRCSPRPPTATESSRSLRFPYVHACDNFFLPRCVLARRWVVYISPLNIPACAPPRTRALRRATRWIFTARRTCACVSSRRRSRLPRGKRRQSPPPHDAPRRALPAAIPMPCWWGGPLRSQKFTSMYCPDRVGRGRRRRRRGKKTGAV